MAISDNHEYMILGHKRIEDTLLGVVFSTLTSKFSPMKNPKEMVRTKNFQISNLCTVKVLYSINSESQGYLIPSTMTIS